MQMNKRKIHMESPHHGKNATRLYGIWLGMRARCNIPNYHDYKYYGLRGIKVCDEWNDYLAFKEWAINNGYADNLTLDRIDVNSNYCPGNCRWATKTEQGNNRRNNHLLTYNGETKTLKEWSDVSGIPYSTLKRRINVYGFTVKEALTLPVKMGNNQNLRGGDSQ